MLLHNEWSGGNVGEKHAHGEHIRKDIQKEPPVAQYIVDAVGNNLQ